MSENSLEAPVAAFVALANEHRATLNPDHEAQVIQGKLDAWTAEFLQRNGVRPTREQVNEKHAAEAAALAAQRTDADAVLETSYRQLRADYTAAAEAAQELPGELEQLQAERKPTAHNPAGGISYQESALARLLDLQQTAAIERRLAGQPFEVLESTYEAAAARGDVPVLRTIERLRADGWPGVPSHGAESAMVLDRLARRIEQERAARVPPSVRAALSALDAAWNGVTFVELRRIARSRRLGVAG